MKKALIVLLLLAVAGGLFAQGLTLTGLVESGLTVFIPDDDTVYMRATARDAEVNGYRTRLNGAYANADANAGFNFRIDADGVSRAPLVKFGYAWVKAFDNMIELQGGNIDNGTFNSGGGILDGDQGEGFGLLVLAKPVGDMLTLGFGGYAHTNNGDFSDIRLDQAKYTFNAKVLVPDLVQVTATFRNPNAIGKGYVVPANPADKFETVASTWSTPNDNDARGIFGVKVLAIPELTAAVEAEVRNVDDFSDNGVLNLFETVGYKTGDIQVQLNAAQYLVLADLPDGTIYDPALRFWLWATYTLNEGTIVPRLDVNYFLGGKWNAGENIHYKNYAVDEYNKDRAIFAIRPSVQFKADANSWFELGYQLNANLDNSTGGETTINHLIMSGVRVSF